jgi:hypothetical protein
LGAFDAEEQENSGVQLSATVRKPASDAVPPMRNSGPTELMQEKKLTRKVSSSDSWSAWQAANKYSHILGAASAVSVTSLQTLPPLSFRGRAISNAAPSPH